MPAIPRGMDIEDVERDVLCAMLTDEEARTLVVRRGLKREAFSTELGAAVFRAVLTLHERGDLITDMNVAHESNVSPTVIRALWSRLGGLDRPLVPVQYGMRLIADHAAVRFINTKLELASQLSLVALQEGEVAVLEMHLRRVLETVSRFRSLRESTESPSDLAARVDLTHYWLVPGVLERRDRLMIVAPEGSGKSFLLRQWGVMLAAGSHWATGGYGISGRVLIVDCENSEAQVAREFTPLEPQARSYSEDWNDRCAVRVMPLGLDLRDARDVTTVTSMIENYRPDLLIIGPLYRLAGDAGQDWERHARDLQRVFDAWRIEFDLAIAIEHHSGHANDENGRRAVRPMGSSAWLRWPEIGLALKWDAEEHEFTVGRFRGDRGGARLFPPKLRHAGRGVSDWPWVADWENAGGLRTRVQAIIDQERALARDLTTEIERDFP